MVAPNIELSLYALALALPSGILYGMGLGFRGLLLTLLAGLLFFIGGLLGLTRVAVSPGLVTDPGAGLAAGFAAAFGAIIIVAVLAVLGLGGFVLSLIGCLVGAIIRRKSQAPKNTLSGLGTRKVSAVIRPTYP